MLRKHTGFQPSLFPYSYFLSKKSTRYLKGLLDGETAEDSSDYEDTA
jgi:hypothetical protein